MSHKTTTIVPFLPLHRATIPNSIRRRRLPLRVATGQPATDTIPGRSVLPLRYGAHQWRQRQLSPLYRHSNSHKIYSYNGGRRLDFHTAATAAAAAADRSSGPARSTFSNHVRIFYVLFISFSTGRPAAIPSVLFV